MKEYTIDNGGKAIEGYPNEYILVNAGFSYPGWRLVCLDTHPAFDGEVGIMELWDHEPAKEEIDNAMRNEMLNRPFRKNWAQYKDSDTYVYGAIWNPLAIMELVELVIDRGLTKEQAKELFDNASNNALMADAGDFFVELGNVTTELDREE